MNVNYNFSNNKRDRDNLLGYIIPILMDYIENNRVDLLACYEACHELELMIADQCNVKGIKSNELQYHKQIAETDFRTSKDSLVRK